MVAAEAQDGIRAKPGGNYGGFGNCEVHPLGEQA